MTSNPSKEAIEAADTALKKMRFDYHGCSISRTEIDTMFKLGFEVGMTFGHQEMLGRVLALLRSGKISSEPLSAITGNCWAEVIERELKK